MYGNRLSTYWLQLCRIKGRWPLLFCLLAIFTKTQAQPGLSLELAKPKNYESRTLPSEKSSSTKFHAPKRFYHDLVSRFNYYFNANNRLNEIIDRARQAHHDDFTHLLSFYDYTLDQTAKGDIDTILYKCTAGILLHDLRSDWVDKLYLLMGKAYLYRKNFDSATLVFQYINYAFAPKDNGYDIPIGSNASNTNGVFTIATRENRSLWKKLMSFPPSRNESFLWQARTYIESDDLVSASSLLELIRTDPNFPERLRPQLEELTAYLLYNQHNYGAAAAHLMLALDDADNREEQARWEFLAGQMYELANENTQAIQAFEKAIQHTTNPLLEVYARMRVVYLSSAGRENALQQNLDQLLKMARRDRYEEFRHIIYYAAATLELSRQHYDAAQSLLIKSAATSGTDLEQKQKSFLLLGDMNYQIRHYPDAYRFYDSIQSLLLQDS
ncbi:MAG TPA: hypothetical protein VG842_07765, partial [Sediminibacterium sp.]|nr:hypothetical protein [Sediminibacterium sp.]